MPYSYYNPNPTGKRVGDCAIRAVAKALNVDWPTAYAMVVSNGFTMGDMPSSDAVWGNTLRQSGFIKEIVPNTCPDCYTAKDSETQTLIPALNLQHSIQSVTNFMGNRRSLHRYTPSNHHLRTNRKHT